MPKNELPDTITVKQTTMDKMLDQLAQSKFNEEKLAALLFGKDAAGKGFDEITARVRALLAIADAAEGGK